MFAARICALLLSLALVGMGCRSDSRAPGSSAGATGTGRTTAEVRREGNHLLGSGSAYLRQHARNPVDWFAWGPEALSLASRLDRPIFLSIGYVSCHWCHVMEQEVFEQDDVAAFLNAHFVSIKVDREERPDLDAAYMQAVQAMTGSGGWPMTLFLTPSLHPFFGATYLPRDRFFTIARNAIEQFRTARSAVEMHGAEVHRALASPEPTGPSDALLKTDELRALARAALAEVDPIWGGFRGRTKFPTPVRWRFLLHAYRKWGDDDVVRALRKTLDAMEEGGLHDHLGGGFFRYATEPTWTIPHFEKMLYDNAELASLYLETSAATGDPRYAAVGLDTLDFLLRELQSPDGGFGASIDADSAGKEGAFYLWTPGELSEVLGEVGGSELADQLGATASGNFDKTNVLTRRPHQNGRAPSGLAWDQARWKLYEARRRRPAPAYDTKMVTAWNGLAISALSLGYRAAGDERLLDGAERAAEALWRRNRHESGELARASNDGHPSERAVLDDYADFALGLLDLFDATSKPVHLQRALALTSDAISRFACPSGGWFFTAADEQEPLGRRLETIDGAEPSGNATMILVLERLATLTGRRDFDEAARSALRSQAGAMRARSLDMMGWLDGAVLAAGPSYELIVAGADDATTTHALWEVHNRLLAPWATGARVGTDGPSAELEKLMPPATGKHAANGRALGYVCKMGSCKAPRADPARLRKDLSEGWLH